MYSPTTIEGRVVRSWNSAVVFTTDDAAPQSMSECRRRRSSMAAIDDVWLAALTKDEDDAGSKNRFNLTVNIDGGDVFRHDFLLGWNLPGQGGTGLRDGQAGLEEAKPPAPFDSDKLTNSSVRLGLRGDDAWAPKHVMVIGRAQPDFTPGRFLALAMETDIERWLSADSDEGRADDARAPRRCRNLQHDHPSRAAADLHRPRERHRHRERHQAADCRQRAADAGPEDHPRLRPGSRLLAFPRRSSGPSPARTSSPRAPSTSASWEPTPGCR